MIFFYNEKVVDIIITDSIMGPATILLDLQTATRIMLMQYKRAVSKYSVAVMSRRVGFRFGINSAKCICMPKLYLTLLN